MKISKIVDSRVGYLAAAVLTLVSFVAPVAITSNVSAAVVTARSIEMSDSTANADNLTYTLKFTTGASGAAGAAIIAFCAGSPIIGDACAGPTGFSVTGTSSDIGTASAENANTILYTNTIAASATHTVEFDSIDNPTAAGQFYARILTFADATAAGVYDETDGSPTGTYIDEGGFALSATNPINVSAAVRESMTFCVSAGTLTANCAGATSPNLELGSGNPVALATGVTSTGTIYTQVSTNASEGVTVKMRSNKECGGLQRQGADPDDCGIPPVGTGTNAIDGTTAMFGMKVNPDADLTATTNYAGSNYGLNWADNDATGVTSPYGDSIYSSDGPVSSKNAVLTFAAAADNLTPAGRYSAALNLIATGTF